ncbi:MAG: T9SS type A sorting domain-containing protein [Bacteroidetes bacterium]|nr:T9SS type A sorting domain-containing protein [Bacteroidota bacterium]MDA0973479.1 T9SS type A sorting domain-containing protein [Bacteroidota bacterium]
MKHLYMTLALLMAMTTASAQIVFESNFETWSSVNEPDGWRGSKTSFSLDSSIQVTDGATFGPYLVELVNVQGPHRRFTTQGIALSEGLTYEVEVWAKGDADVRVGLYDFDLDGNDFGFNYNSYETVSSSSVISFVQTVVPDTTFGSCEVIISVIGGIVQLDRVEIRLGEAAEPDPKTIQEIQFTTNVSGASPEVGNLIITTGVVTAVANNGYWIQDGEGAWNGIRVRDQSNTVNLGDEVSVTGTVEEYFSFTRITDVVAVSSNGPGSIPAPSVLGTFATNDEAFEGVLVRSSGACTATVNGFGEWFISDGSGDIMVNDEMFAFTPGLGTNYQVTGLLNYAFSAYKIEPRDAGDVSVVSGLNEVTNLDVSIYPNPVVDELIIEQSFTGAAVYQIYNIKGQLVQENNLTDSIERINVSDLSNGTYTLILITDGALGQSTFEVVR